MKKSALKKRGSAATVAEKAKINNYGKRFSKTSYTSSSFIFAATEVYGTHGLRFNALLRSIASHVCAVPQPYGYRWALGALHFPAPAADLRRSAPWESQGARRLACALVVHGGSPGVKPRPLPAPHCKRGFTPLK